LHARLLRHRLAAAASSSLSPLRFVAAAMSSSSAAPGGGRKPNRLAAEHSPYLLQHAHNPVDWYPWGDEAFEKARKLDIPIFLSSNALSKIRVYSSASFNTDIIDWIMGQL
uniref:Spermatogenesis-associated protein 20-like TRX domain-containing protein n=1 Tax=Aegilops tauschii subsp. strangulata TaxID=200361 RepID=A0A453GH35_AEGTS